MRGLIEALRRLPAGNAVRIRCVSSAQAKQAFSGHGAAAGTKHEIATTIAQQLPELGGRLPPRRKPWMSEPEAMAIFDAVALALTFYRLAQKRRRTSTEEPLSTLHAT